MSPDSPEARIGRLETAVARLEQRTEDLRGDVRDLMPLLVAVAEMRGAMVRVQGDLSGLATGQAALKREFTDGQEALERELRSQNEDRQKAQREAFRDSRNWRRALILGSFTVLAAIIAAAATIIASSPS